MTSTTRVALIGAIGAIADQIDRHYGNPPGTAIRGIYYWYWPAASCDLDTLRVLHRDAVGILAELTAPEFGDPCQLCTNPMETPGAVTSGICDACKRTLGPQRPPTGKEKHA